MVSKLIDGSKLRKPISMWDELDPTEQLFAMLAGATKDDTADINREKFKVGDSVRVVEGSMTMLNPWDAEYEGKVGVVAGIADFGFYPYRVIFDEEIGAEGKAGYDQDFGPDELEVIA